MEFQRPKPEEFAQCTGMRLGPPDQLDQGLLISGFDRMGGKYAMLQNVRVFSMGEIIARAGIGNALYAALDQTSVHSLKRLNDPTPGASNTFLRLIGAGTKLYANGGASIDTGYSGNPLSFVAYRPDQSVQPWMYVADANKMVKVRSDKTVYQMGIAPPNAAPTAVLEALVSATIDNLAVIGSWTVAGTAGALSAVARANTTIAAIKYDTGTTGWATVNPALLDSNIQLGAKLTFNSGGGSAETVIVQSVNSATPTTTIGAIAYDSGSTGLCTISPAASAIDPFDDTINPEEIDRVAEFFGGWEKVPLQVRQHLYHRNALNVQTATILTDSLIRLDSGGASDEYVRVLSVTNGPDGTASLRCSTVNTHSAGQALSGVPSIRVYLANTHAAAETLTLNCLQSSVTAGAGYINETAAFNLGLIGTRIVQPDDLIHVSIKMDNVTNLIEGRLILDVDPTTNDFAHNALYVVFRGNDFARVATGVVSQLAAQQQAIQNSYITGINYDSPANVRAQVPAISNMMAPIDDPNNGDGGGGGNGGGIDPAGGVGTGQTGTGSSQWHEFYFRAADFQRLGTDTSRTLANVAAIRFQFQVSDTTVINVSSLWIGGSYGPDVGTNGSPLMYRFRFRSSASGARSNASPPTRSGINPHRQQVTLSGTHSADAQVDKVDWYRWGGGLSQWTYIGTGPNASPPTFADIYQDDAIAASELLETDNFQPFPVLDLPRSGTCNIAGTSVARVSGDNFNTAWAPGSEVRINGFLYHLYASPTSTSKLELIENAGSQTGVSFELPQATLLGQSLPVMFGATEELGQMFGLGSTYQAGTLFWTNGNNPDSASDVNQYDLTSPSEPLMNGCMVDTRPTVATSGRWFGLYPDLNGTSWRPIQLPISRGLFARWGFCTDGENIWYIATDGIYLSVGGNVENSITDGDLLPIFPHNGVAGVAVTRGSVTIAPPDFTQTSRLRLSCADGYVYFDYLDTNSKPRTLVYDTRRRAWSYDLYNADPTSTFGAITHYGEEGSGIRSLLMSGPDGCVYQFGGQSDAGAGISCVIGTLSFNAGDGRAKKLYGDIDVDLNGAANASGITAKIYANAYATIAATSTLATGASGRSHYIADLGSGTGYEARDVALELSWTEQVAVALYGWQPSFVIRPEDTFLRGTDWDEAGYPGAKWVQGLILDADTSNIGRTVQVQGDAGAVGATITATHNGREQKPYSFTPFIAHLLRLMPTDAASWQVMGVRYVFEPMPELAVNWTTQPTTHDLPGYQHLRDAYVTLISTATVTLTVTVDGTAYAFTVASTGGAQRKVYVEFSPNLKGKTFQYTLTSSAAFRLFVKDSQVNLKAWGSEAGYQSVTPFGDISRSSGARI